MPVHTEPGDPTSTGPGPTPRESDPFDVSALRAAARTHVPRGPERSAPTTRGPEPRARAGRPVLRAAALAAGAGLMIGGGGDWASLGRPGPVLSTGASTGAGTARGPAEVLPGGADWAAVLRDLDRRRARAFAAADAGVLRQVYAPASAPLATDVASIAALRAAGLRGTGLRVRIDRVRVAGSGPGRVDLDVADRLAGYALTDRRGVTRARVPGRGAATWRVRLVPAGTGWLISTVTRAAP